MMKTILDIINENLGTKKPKLKPICDLNVGDTFYYTNDKTKHIVTVTKRTNGGEEDAVDIYFNIPGDKNRYSLTIRSYFNGSGGRIIPKDGVSSDGESFDKPYGVYFNDWRDSQYEVFATDERMFDKLVDKYLGDYEPEDDDD